MVCLPPRAPRRPGMRTSSLAPSPSPTRGPRGEGPRALPGPRGRQGHQGLQVPRAPKVTGARQERRAQWGLQGSWGHRGPVGFLERWGAPVPQDPPAQQEARASRQVVPKVSSTRCSRLRIRTTETPSWHLPCWTPCWRASQGPEVPPVPQVPPDHMAPQDPQEHLDPRAWLASRLWRGRLASLV